MPMPTTDRCETATYCATLVDEWARAGVTDAVVAPGSRSTPLVLALAASPLLRTHVVLDERSAGFVGLGLGLAQGRPAVVVTTSGTAAAELHAAVIEAHQSAVPLLVCTADRPPELQQVGAPQTIDQNRLYGSAVRFFADPGPPVADRAGDWRSVASRAVLECLGPVPGPVHLNLPFREPLVGRPGSLPPGRPAGGPWHHRLNGLRRLDPGEVSELVGTWSGRRGLFVAGRGVDDPRALEALADRLGWPILAEPRSGCDGRHRTVVARADGMLRDAAVANTLIPEVVVGVGEPPASKVLDQWLASLDAVHVAVDPAGRVLDPGHRVGLFLQVDMAALCEQLVGPERREAPVPRLDPAPRRWLGAWRAADDSAEAALEDALLDRPEASEPATARALLRAARPGDAVVASSSMPVRDLEWYGPRRADVAVLANRGANGIDGVVSTALGVALGGPATWLLIGDLALLHDANGLLGCHERPLRLRLVVADNGGGGIFSFLPQAQALPGDDFERFFGTPQAVDVAALLALHGIPATEATTAAEVDQGLADLAGSTQPVSALVVRTERAANVTEHERLNAAMAAAAHRALDDGAGGLASGSW